MAMIGVPLMNSGINPYKQTKPNVRNTPSDAPKLSDSPQRSRRRYQSEMIVDNQAIKSARKRYQSENQQLIAEMTQITLKQKSNKNSSTPNVSTINDRTENSTRVSLKQNSSISRPVMNSPNSELHMSIRKASRNLPPILEEKCPSLTDLHEFVKQKSVESRDGGKNATGRRRSVSETEIHTIKMHAKRQDRWKRWNPMNFFRTHMKASKPKQESNHMADSDQNVNASCNLKCM